MERRELLKGVGLAVAGTAALSAASSAAHAAGAGTATAAGTAPSAPKSPYDGKMLVNRPRAHAVLEELKLDGLIALNTINVYYLTNTVPYPTFFRADIPGFATFARDPSQPSFLVTNYSMDFANPGRELPEIITWSGVANWQDYIDATPAQMKVPPKLGKGHDWPTHPGVKLTAREQAWHDVQAKYAASAVAAPAWALAKALKQSGLTKGRIAIDDIRIAAMLQEIGMDQITFVPGTEVFRKIRMVKSEPELALQRIGGRNNYEAAMATARAIQRGMTYEDIQQLFRVEAAKRGNETMFFLAGTINGGFPGPTVPVGSSFAIDAVSHYKQYHGDFGRTVVLGEPSKDILAREKAHNAGYDAIYSVLKAGMKLSEVQKIVLDAETKAGLSADIVTCGAHSVGLEHGDNPRLMNSPYGPIEDIALEENMVITVDMPYIEFGGNIGHHEDLVRITKTGFETFGEHARALVVV
jgi:Xaa-Pro aminopeptidase